MKLMVELDTTNLRHRQFLEEELRHEASSEEGPLAVFARHVARTKVGRTVIVPVLRAISHNTPYSAAELGTKVGLSAKMFGHRISVLGRIERQYPSLQVFVRLGEGRDRRYMVSDVMKQAILAAHLKLCRSLPKTS